MAVKNPDLFAGQSERTKRLHAAAKKALREKARKRWWDTNGHNHDERKYSKP